MFFYIGHDSESEGGCENDNNDDGNGCEGSDGGDVFFYRGVDVALWTEAQQRAGGDILKPGININLIDFGRNMVIIDEVLSSSFAV